MFIKRSKDKKIALHLCTCILLVSPNMIRVLCDGEVIKSDFFIAGVLIKHFSVCMRLMKSHFNGNREVGLLRLYRDHEV